MNQFNPPSAKLTSADFAEHHAELRQEDYPAVEKLKVARTQIIVSLVQAVLGVALTIYAFFLWSIYPFFLTKGLIIIGISVAIIGLISFLSCLKDVSNLKRVEKTEYWFDTSSHSSSRLVFILSVIQAGFLFVYVVTIFVSQTTVKNYITANTETQDASNTTWDSYQGYLQIAAFLSCLSILAIFRTTYSAFVFSNSPHFFRLALYFFSIFTLCLVGCLVYAAESTGYLNNIHSLEEVTNYFTIRLLVWLSLLITIVLITIILTNFTKKLTFFMSIATLLLLICLVLVSFNGSVYRDSRKINEYVEKNCQNQMQIINEEDLKLLGCPNKYILRKQDQPYPDCERSYQAINWESDIGKANEDKINAIECLNTKCCGLSGKIYSDWFLLIATLGKLVSVFSFVIIGMCCFLSTRFTGNPKLSQEFIYVALAVLAVLVWILIIKYFPFEPIKEKPGLIAELPSPDTNSEIYKTYGYSHVTKRAECEKTFAEYFQLYYNQPFSKTEAFQCSGDCSNTLIRVGVTATYYKITVSQSFDDKDLKIYDSRFYSVFNDGKSLDDSQNFIGAEGSVKSVRNFLASSICLTAFEQQANHNLVVSVKKFDKESETNSSGKQLQHTPVVSNPMKKELVHQSNSNQFKYFVFENANANASENTGSEANPPPPEFRPQGEENLTQIVRFQTIELIVKDSETDQEIKGKKIKVDVYYNQVECILQEAPARISLESHDSKFVLKNLESSTYTAFVKTDGYNYMCKRITLTEHNQSTQQTVFLTPLLQKEEIRLVLEWSNSNFARLDLLSTMTISEKDNCVVGYLNDNCPQLQYERKTQRPFHQSIKISNLAATEYLIYIKQNLTLKEYKELLDSGKDNMNQILAESSAHISIYVAGLEYPVQESGLSPLDPAFKDEENLVWIIACLNGSYGNIVYPLNQYWTYSSTHEYIFKKNNQQLPPAEICTKYRSSLKK